MQFLNQRGFYNQKASNRFGVAEFPRILLRVLMRAVREFHKRKEQLKPFPSPLEANCWAFFASVGFLQRRSANCVRE
jgi:hypothetical protein